MRRSIFLRIPGSARDPPSVRELQDLGVARVSLGSGLMKATLALIKKVADELSKGDLRHAVGCDDATLRRCDGLQDGHRPEAMRSGLAGARAVRGATVANRCRGCNKVNVYQKAIFSYRIPL